MVAAVILAEMFAGSGVQASPPAFDLAQRSVILQVHAAGAQIYECVARDGKPPAWTFREPIATLVKGGATVGRHYAGPSWELDDGGVITGRVADTQPGPTPTDIPQLKLDVVARFGHGLLDQASTVYRVGTSGGRLAGPCAIAGDLRAVPYTSDYVFTK